MVIIVLIVTLCSEVFGAGQHDAVFKSIDSTSSECARYLTNAGVEDCNTHCVGVVSHVWNDKMAMFTRNYGRFFIAAPDDLCNRNRTERCMLQVDKVVPVSDKCARANQLGRCFVDQYGQLNASQFQYRPMTNVQYNRVFLQCVSMLGLSNDVLKEVATKGVDVNVAAFACLIRCTMIRMGLYSDDTGFDLTLATAQCGKYDPALDPVQCQAKVKAEECDLCQRMFRIAKECLGLRYNVKQVDGNQPQRLEFNTKLDLLGFGCIFGCYITINT